MLIHLQSQATTTPKVRAKIQASDGLVWDLACRYGTTEQTVWKWRKRDSVHDRSHTAHRLQTTLTPAQEAVAVALRKTLLVPLDDLLAVVRELGYALQPKYMGMFTADSVEVEGPPDRRTITGLATINGETTSGKTALTDQKKRSWPEGNTVADMVAKVAGEHGLQEAVSKSLAAIALPHIDQIDESDINLLSRVARDHDAIAKPGDGRIVMAKRGESLTASGQPMPSLLLTQSKVSRWRYRNSVRDAVGSVITVYQDLGAGRSQECRAGEGDPIRRIKRRHPNQDAAQRAADAELKRLKRAGRSFSVNMKGNPDAMAEAKLSVAGFRSYIDGEWLVTQATHSLDSGGYRTKVEAEPME